MKPSKTETMKHTPGEVGISHSVTGKLFVTDQYDTIGMAGHQICEVLPDIENGSPEANAELICEAFNVATETGLTPRQLAEQRAQLLAALENVVNHGAHGMTAALYSHAKAAISNATKHLTK